MSGIGIEVDTEYTSDLLADIEWSAKRAFTEDEQFQREELEKIERGEWTAYGVFLLDADGEPDYSHALWGCVVETSNAAGSYSSPGDVPDEYLAEVARDLEAGLWTEPLPLRGAIQPSLFSAA